MTMGYGRFVWAVTVVCVILGSCECVEGNMFETLLSSFGGAGGGLGGLKGKMEGMRGKLKNGMSEMHEEMSVLSSIFGDGVTRADVTLPQVVNRVFSRKNGIAVGDAEVDGDWKYGDGSSVIGGMTSGGGISVTKKNGSVLITLSNGQKQRGSESADPEESGEEVEWEEKEGVSGSGRTMDEAFISLMSDWEKYVSSSVWDEQDERKNEGLKVSGRIVNGLFLGNGIAAGAPFASKLFYDEESKFYCSGSLISERHILTAAHCGVVVGDWVRVGGRTLRSGFSGRVSKVSVHPGYNGESLSHDVAVVTVSGLPDAGGMRAGGVGAAWVNWRGGVPEEGFVGVVSAHGASEVEGGEMSEVLVSTRQRVHGLEKCRWEIRQGRVEEDGSFVCVGDGERSTTCVGDSGAGLWRFGRMEGGGWGYEVVAVVSFGEVGDKEVCPRGMPAVFQRTAANYGWIRTVVDGRE